MPNSLFDTASRGYGGATARTPSSKPKGCIKLGAECALKMPEAGNRTAPSFKPKILLLLYYYYYALHFYNIRWASARENLSYGVCEQHRRRPACASAQSDQRLCYSPFGKYHI